MTYFPAPLETMEVALCVSGCPLESIPEAICIYSPNRETDFERICYDSYPSRPVYSAYCLPAQAALRSPVLDLLWTLDLAISFWMRDILNGSFPLGIAAIASTATTSFFLLFPLLCRFKHSYRLSHFLVMWEMGYICYSLFIQGEKSEEKVCADYENVHMEHCSMPKEVSECIFYAYVALYWTSLILLTRLYKQNQTILPIIEAVVPKGSYFLCLYQYLLLAAGLACYSLFLVLAVCQASIGSTSDVNNTAVFPYPGQTWAFSWASRGLLVLTFCTVIWVLDAFVGCGLLTTWERARKTGWKETMKSCWKAKGALVIFGSNSRTFAIFVSTVPCLHRFLKNYMVYPPYIPPPEAFPPSHMIEKATESILPPVHRPLTPLSSRDYISVAMATLPIEACIYLSGPVAVLACSNDSQDVASPMCLAVVSSLFSWYLAQIVGSYYYGLAHSGPISHVQVSVVPINSQPTMYTGRPIEAISRYAEVSFRYAID